MRRRDEAGTILVLTIGFLVIAMLLVWAVVDASAVFLQRRDLAAAADATALDAAQHVDVAALYVHGTRGDLPLDAAAVDREVRDYTAAHFPGWTFRGRASGPHTVTVTATRVVHLPVYGDVTVTATASATDRTAA